MNKKDTESILSGIYDIARSVELARDFRDKSKSRYDKFYWSLFIYTQKVDFMNLIKYSGIEDLYI